MDPQIGPYRIESELGRGGMGVVYRAIDTTLDRTVAIKALPAELANDPGRLDRFEREAKTLAQLNHPNLAGIHGLERHSSQSGEATYLVLEFVEGETLADRLDRGSMEPDEAVELAIQIAAGVEAAHEADVIHRDLKPANIMITPEGQAKVLDFGLAKADEGHSSTGSGMSQSPTMTSPVQNSPTMPGVILGTAAYMSPEQARGRRVDKRSDIWSFGVILFEMLTGVSPFVGETASDSIGAVLHKSFNFDRLPPTTPGNARRVLQRCLQRDKNLRYRDIGDARIELQLQEVEAVPDAIGASRESRGLTWAGWLVGAAALAGLAATVFRSNPAAIVPAPPARFETDLIPRDGLELAQNIAPVRLSPDGTRLAYVGFSIGDSASKVIVRDLRTGTETVLRGPDEPLSVSWEADSKHLVYLAGTRAERINVEGGRLEVLGEVGYVGFTGQTEVAPGGMLAYSGMQAPLAMLDRETRTTTDVIDPIPGRTGDWAVAPSFFPGGEHVLYTNQDDVTADSGLYIASVVTGEPKRLLPFESTGRVVGQDNVLYSRDAFLFVQRVDLATLSLVGEPVQVAGPVYRKGWPMFASFDATEDTLVYVTQTLADEGMQFFEHDLATGGETPLGEKGSLWSPRFSPDGTRIAFDRTVDATAGDIAVLDLETGVETMLSRDQSNESSPRWSRDGKWVYFFRGPDIYKVRSDGRSSPELVIESDVSNSPIAETPDGKSLMYNLRGAASDIMVVNLETGKTSAWLDTEADENGMGFLPGGDWFVYTSDISGEHRVYASLYNGEGVPVQLTGDVDPWVYIGADRIFFAQARAIISLRVTVKDDRTLEVGEQETVMQSEGINDYLPTPDGTGLLLNRPIKPKRGGRMKIIQNWMPGELD